MNIFSLHDNPRISAQYHNDKHVVKMITETAQILSTVHHNHDEWKADYYRPAFYKHPSVLWAGETKANYQWLVRLGLSLYDEYKFRYGQDRTHKAGEKIANVLATPPTTIKDKPRTKFSMAMPDEYKNDNPIKAYRDYYMGDKRHLASWKVRGVPTWWK